MLVEFSGSKIGQNTAASATEFGKIHRPQKEDEDLIAEFRANEDVEENFSYHQGNYDLAKIQQANMMPR